MSYTLKQIIWDWMWDFKWIRSPRQETPYSVAGHRCRPAAADGTAELDDGLKTKIERQSFCREKRKQDGKKGQIWDECEKRRGTKMAEARDRASADALCTAPGSHPSPTLPWTLCVCTVRQTYLLQMWRMNRTLRLWRMGLYGCGWVTEVGEVYQICVGALMTSSTGIPFLNPFPMNFALTEYSSWSVTKPARFFSRIFTYFYF